MQAYTLVSCILAYLAAGANSEVRGGSRDHIRRSPPQTRTSVASSTLGAVIPAKKCNGKTNAAEISDERYGVAVGGSIENYSQWPLMFEKCHVEDGYMNIAPQTVQPGMQEGFASHKTAHTAKGSWLKCSFAVDGKTLVHFMYSAPHDFNLHSNWLAVAICPKADHSCAGLDVNDMYYYSYGFLGRKEFYYDSVPLTFCREDLCVVAQMGTSHKPTVSLKVFPQNYKDLAVSGKIALERDMWAPKDYDTYIRTIDVL